MYYWADSLREQMLLLAVSSSCRVLAWTQRKKTSKPCFPQCFLTFSPLCRQQSSQWAFPICYIHRGWTYFRFKFRENIANFFTSFVFKSTDNDEINLLFYYCYYYLLMTYNQASNAWFVSSPTLATDGDVYSNTWFIR